eukprot:4555940-Prymnesium_polylepis.1
MPPAQPRHQPRHPSPMHPHRHGHRNTSRFREFQYWANVSSTPTASAPPSERADDVEGVGGMP